jgi:Fe-Mn family superoxide dismutase
VEGRPEGDGQNTFPVWNAAPLVALDVYEHAYFGDFGTDRGAYIDAFFDNLDYAVIDGWVEAYGIRA